MQEFKINKFGVIENPEEIVIHKKGEGLEEISIKLASYGGRWKFGFDIETAEGSCQGSSSGVCFNGFRNHEQTFETRYAALKAGYKYICKQIDDPRNFYKQDFSRIAIVKLKTFSQQTLF